MFNASRVLLIVAVTAITIHLAALEVDLEWAIVHQLLPENAEPIPGAFTVYAAV